MTFRGHVFDLVVAVTLAVTAAVGVSAVASTMEDRIVATRNFDIWFRSDSPRVFENLTTRWGMQGRSRVHPLFALVAATPVVGSQRILGVSAKTAVRGWTAVMAMLWVGVLFLMLRVVGLRTLDAGIFTILGMSSAAAVFWTTVPETYALGSITVMAAVIVTGLAVGRPVKDRWFVAAGVATFAITITNWLVGLLAAAVHRPWTRVVRIALVTGVAVLALWGIQRVLYPRTAFFLGKSMAREKRYVFAPGPARLVSVPRALVFHSVIMPRLDTVREDRVATPVLAVQTSPIRSVTPWGYIAVISWAALLVLGVLAARDSSRRALVVVAVGGLAGQLALHLVYGEETFLYALHWLPLLIVLASLSALGRRRLVALVLAGVVTVFGGINNMRQFDMSRRYFMSVTIPSADTSAARPAPALPPELPLGR